MKKVISKKEAKALGLKKYYTGVPCKNGHDCERYIGGGCVECIKIHTKRVREETPEVHREYDRKRRERKGDEINAKNRERYREDPDRHKAYQAKYREENKEKLPEIRKRCYEKHGHKRRREASEWARENRDVVNQRKRRAYAENPLPASTQHHRRRAAKMQRLMSGYDELDDFCMDEARDLCWQREEMFGFKWQIDHMVPLRASEASGLHYHKNIQVIPASLNCAKSNRMLYTEDLEWLADATSEE